MFPLFEGATETATLRDRREKVAAATSSSELWIFAHRTDTVTLRAVLQHPLITENIYMWIVSNRNWKTLRVPIYQHKYAPATLLDEGIKTGGYSLLKEIIKSPNLSVEQMLRIVTNERVSHKLKEQLIQREDCPDCVRDFARIAQ